MKKTFLLIAALIIGATGANAQRFISTDAIPAKDKAAVKESVAKPFKKQVNNSTKDFVYGEPAISVSFDDASQYLMENLPGHSAGTAAGMFHRLDTSAASTSELASTFPRFHQFFAIATEGYYYVAMYAGHGDESGFLIGDGYALVSPLDVYYADGQVNSKSFNTAIRITEPVETTGFNTVDVVFNQYTKRFNQDRYFVDYSTDANFTTYDSIEFNVKGLEIGSNEMTRGQKIVTLPVANTVDQTALYVRFRYKCDRLKNSVGAYITNLPSGYRWIIDEVKVYDGPEYRINLVNSNHYNAAYGVIPQGMEMDTIKFTAVVENTGGNTLFNASVEERFHNAEDYVFPNAFSDFLDFTNTSDEPVNITTVVRNDSTFNNNTGALEAVDIRRHVELEAGSTHQYNEIAGLYGISSGVKYIETTDATDYDLIAMDDSIYYRVSQMPELTDPLGTARWASDVDVLIEGRAYAYGFEGGYISDNAPGAIVSGYEVCNRFITPSNLAPNTYFAKGVEVVPASDSCDAGVSIKVSLKYMDFNSDSWDAFVQPYKVGNTPVASAITQVQVESLNNGMFTNPDATEWAQTYNSVYLPFEQEQVVLEPDQWYFACYQLLDDARFYVAKDDKDYLPTFQTYDWWSNLILTPGQESEGYSWGYPFGEWLSEYNQPMIRLMVSKNPNAITDVESLVPSFNLNAYPNPAQNETTIEYTLNTNSSVIIVVTDIMGREVVRFNEGAKLANSVSRVSLNTANLNNGTYFYTINANGVKETKKLVINK